MAGTLLSEFGICGEFVTINQGSGVFSRLDFNMDLDPHHLLIVLSQADPKRRGMLQCRGVTEVASATDPMLGGSAPIVSISDYDTHRWDTS
jgi:hypothetical protein